MCALKSRRTFIKQGATIGALAGIGEAALLSKLNPVSASEATLDPNVVQLRPEIEPTVRLIEQTPRDRLLEEIAARIRGGLSYREVLAALLLAGVRNVEPRPSVGFKFHTVLVVNSAHLASMSSPAEHRWLPIFWALDYFKAAARRDVEERGDWTMSAVDESDVPTARHAQNAFTQAMDDWDVTAADAAVAGLARSAGANLVYELLFRYGMRDFRDIGHKAIYVANSYRTLQCIGWQHAEPVLRSLSYALLAHRGDDNPARSDYEADRPYRRNQELAAKFPVDWAAGRDDSAASNELIAGLRTAGNDEACDQVVALLERGVSAQSIWDGLHSAAAELLMRQPGIVALHAVTTTNALYFAYQTTADDQTRRLLMLQNAAFLPMFREAMQGRGDLTAGKIDQLEPIMPTGSGAEAIDEIFADLSGNADAATAKALSYLNGNDARDVINAARVLIFTKGNNAHDYKFSSAVLEDYYHVSPNHRAAYLAANMHMLRGSQLPDNGLVERTRAALGA